MRAEAVRCESRRQTERRGTTGDRVKDRCSSDRTKHLRDDVEQQLFRWKTFTSPCEGGSLCSRRTVFLLQPNGNWNQITILVTDD